MSRPLAAVYAADEAGGIGRGGALPWHLPGDMAFFRKLTSDAPEGRSNAVIMGRKTYESIPARFRPLPKRLNVVLSERGFEAPPGVLVAASLDDALAELEARSDVHRVYVIGGAQIYTLALADARCRTVYLTRVHARFDCDAFVPPLDPSFELTAESTPLEEGGIRFTHQTFERSREGE
jgi:dihydrofolate reductase